MKRTSTALIVTALLATALAVQTRALPALDDDRAIVHVLNRIGFGPRPGDVERIRQMGLQRYLETQLHPEQIADAALVSRLSGFETLGLSSRQIADRYQRPLLEARRERRADAANATPDTQNKPPEAVQQQAALPMMELSQQKLLRAIYSERQLQEVLTDFWFNHFNVDARKGDARFMLTAYERDTIRPHVLGRFRDLLEADAKSPAMLFYLDNWMSADPNGPHRDQTARGPRGGRGGGAGQRAQALMRPQQPRPNMPRGLNENYGRELLELHTLGVDAGYTQKDVTEVARAFTGWTIDQPRQGGGFHFVAALHDDGEKIVLGHRIKAGGGEHDGEQVLDILATHPATARFIATKLVRRFVSDTPPAALVDRAAERFQKTDGDLRAVMTAILTSPEFQSVDTYNAKVKTPFEFIVSAMRSTGAEVTDARPLVRSLQQLGMPLYQCQPPTGYKDTADVWINTGALVNRMNVAQTLASGRTPAVRMPDTVTALTVVPVNLSDATRATIARATTPPQAIALALGSPEFQRR
jgi:uncharacterized protein (DUF1800 family)